MYELRSETGESWAAGDEAKRIPHRRTEWLVQVIGSLGFAFNGEVLYVRLLMGRSDAARAAQRKRLAAPLAAV